MSHPATTVPRDFNVWEGVYATFAEAPAVGPGFAGDIWRERSRLAALECTSQLERGEPLDYSLRQRNALLPVLVAVLLNEHARVSVLDFGGGLGTGFMVIAGAVPVARARIDYHVVEVDGICEAGRALFAGRAGPSFINELPAGRSFDLVHTTSTLQYIEDWRGVVEQLASFGAPYLVIGDVFAGPFASFATLQNYYGSRIRHWFVNFDELVCEVERHGYRLALKSDCNVKVLGVHGPLPMANLPSELQIRNSHHLLFCRSRVTAPV